MNSTDLQERIDELEWELAQTENKLKVLQEELDKVWSDLDDTQYENSKLKEFLTDLRHNILQVL